MDTLIGFVTGLFLGGTLTMVIMSLCIASSRRDKFYDWFRNNGAIDEKEGDY